MTCQRCGRTTFHAARNSRTGHLECANTFLCDEAVDKRNRTILAELTFITIGILILIASSWLFLCMPEGSK